MLRKGRKVEIRSPDKSKPSKGKKTHKPTPKTTPVHPTPAPKPIPVSPAEPIVVKPAPVSPPKQPYVPRQTRVLQIPYLPERVPTRNEKSPEGKALGWAVRVYNNIQALLRGRTGKIDQQMENVSRRANNVARRKWSLDEKLGKIDTQIIAAQDRNILLRGSLTAFWKLNERYLVRRIEARKRQFVNLRTEYQGLSRERATGLFNAETQRLGKLKEGEVTYARAIRNVGYYVPTLRRRFYDGLTQFERKANIYEIERHDSLARMRINDIKSRLNSIRNEDGDRAFKFEIVFRQLQYAEQQGHYQQAAGALQTMHWLVGEHSTQSI